MRMQIQNIILNFISKHPGTRIGDVVRGLPEVERSSISSSLTRLTAKGKLIRVEGAGQCFEYTIAADKPAPVVVDCTRPPALALKKLVSDDEWSARFATAEALMKKGLVRRANRAFLELLDVTAETKLRELIIRRKTGVPYVGASWL